MLIVRESLQIRQYEPHQMLSLMLFEWMKSYDPCHPHIFHCVETYAKSWTAWYASTWLSFRSSCQNLQCLYCYKRIGVFLCWKFLQWRWRRYSQRLIWVAPSLLAWNWMWLHLLQ
jgi:hypothetical protein